MSWEAVLLPATVLLPLLLALGVLWPAGRALALRLLPLAPAPTLILGMLAPESAVEADRIMLGMRLGLDEAGRVFAVFTALIWAAAAAHMLSGGLGADTPRERLFLVSFLAAMAGNLGLVFALDQLSFFLFFSLMSLSAYGVIVNNQAAETRFAGRLYLALALFGEMLVLAGLMLAAGGVYGAGYAWLLYWGFGIKHGVVPLHVWLPVAHGTAPAPASALLSGAMLKAGVLGWLRFLPEAGSGALGELSGFVILAGLAAAFYGAAVGILQRKAKMLLGYSSVSQMGILTAAVGVALSRPGMLEAALPVLLLFCLHHGLVKAGLFLGVGVRRGGGLGPLVYPMLVLLALAVVAAPLTGGAWVKLWLEDLEVPAGAPGLLMHALPLTSVASTLLMARFLWLAREPAPAHPEDPAGAAAGALPFLLLAMAGLLAPWGFVAQYRPELIPEMLAAEALWKMLWPVLLAAVPAAGLALLAVQRRSRMPWAIPPGDIAMAFTRIALPLPEIPRRGGPLPAWPRSGAWVQALEDRLRGLGTAGLVYLLVALAISLLVYAF